MAVSVTVFYQNNTKQSLEGIVELHLACDSLSEQVFGNLKRAVAAYATISLQIQMVSMTRVILLELVKSALIIL